MTLILETDGAFADTLAIDMPVMDGAVHLGLYGGNRSQSTRNLVNPDVPFLMTGAPVFASNFATFNSAAYLDSQMKDNPDDTFFFVSRRPAANLGGFGRVIGTANARATYQNTSDTSLFSVVQALNDGTTIFNNTWTRSTDASLFRLHAWRWAYGTGLTTFDFTKTPATGDPVLAGNVAPKVSGQNNVLIGTTSPGAADPTSAVSIAMTAHWARALSDAEITTMATWIRAQMAARGIGV